jgi:hypothetical protein
MSIYMILRIGVKFNIQTANYKFHSFDMIAK